MALYLDALAKQQAEIFNLFRNSRRLLILWSIEFEEKSVSQIAESIGATIQNTSQHLRLLKAKKMVEARRDGQSIYYRTAPITREEKYAYLFPGPDVYLKRKEQ